MRSLILGLAVVLMAGIGVQAEEKAKAPGCDKAKAACGIACKTDKKVAKAGATACKEKAKACCEAKAECCKEKDAACCKKASACKAKGEAHDGAKAKTAKAGEKTEKK